MSQRAFAGHPAASGNEVTFSGIDNAPGARSRVTSSQGMARGRGVDTRLSTANSTGSELDESSLIVSMRSLPSCLLVHCE